MSDDLELIDRDDLLLDKVMQATDSVMVWFRKDPAETVVFKQDGTPIGGLKGIDWCVGVSDTESLIELEDWAGNRKRYTLLMISPDLEDIRVMAGLAAGETLPFERYLDDPAIILKET